MTNKDLADLIFPNAESIENIEKKYKVRDLKEGSVVTRFAPSPTGFVHIGSLFTSFIARKVARQTDGVFILRIEDTDQKRTVENGIGEIIKDLENYGINYDEGIIFENGVVKEKGNYGPYLQSSRKTIYEAFAKSLIERDLAYPCFCTEEDLQKIKEEQELRKDRLGYYGDYAKSRHLTIDEAVLKIKNGEKYIIRLKSPGDFNKKIEVKDLVRGRIEFPENDLDIVLIKGDGLPTYHFAHAVDDHLMRVTHVIRGDEWISSLPVHIQLFQCLNFKVPKYAHLSPLMKVDENGVRRKLSKRHDPESAVSYYHERGIPKEAVMLYIMTVANSNFEQWYEQNRDAKLEDFKFDFKRVGSSGALFDLDKLNNISKSYISRLTAEEVYEKSLEYAKEFDKEFAQILVDNKDIAIAVFSIERYQKKPRKDYENFKDIRKETWYIFDELFKDFTYEEQKVTDRELLKKIISSYLDSYDENDEEDKWFEKIKNIASMNNFAANMKDYREHPEDYLGNVTDIATVLRVALTSKTVTPNLHQISRILGKEKMKERFDKFLQA